MGFDGEGAAGPRADPSEHLPGAAVRNFGVGGRGGPALLGNLLDPRTYVE